MVLFPDVQTRAHEELDRVVGNDRLPELADRDQLPYCLALCKEILRYVCIQRRRLTLIHAYRLLGRWNTVTPLGLPHATHKDDMYAGCFIPAGTIIFANHWCVLITFNLNIEKLTAEKRAISRDPIEYTDPDTFDPERFLPKEGRRVPRDPGKFVFGFGRRRVVFYSYYGGCEKLMTIQNLPG